ncbi:sugar transferase [Neobacillus niacini]|uniref:sugar transferase n=1 Tax=Neobacillus niacini TaxID=86668 RepID=UPI003000436D
MKIYAPIILFVYNRPKHTFKTIEVLKKNILACDSDLIIFSDYAKKDSDLINVNKVRDIINNIDGFKSITIIEQKENQGLAKSIINGVTEVIDKYNKVIVLEDDLITSKYFLSYMNEALDLYERESRIWSISGYGPKIKIPSGYSDDIYLSPRGCSWGWATWKDRWKTINWEINDFDELKNNIQKKKAFNNGGNDMFFMLEDQINGWIDSWAIRWGYNQFKQSKYTVYPITGKSLVSNIGLDFSGTHSSSSDKYNVEINRGNIQLKKDIEVNHETLNEFKKFYDLSLKGYIGVLSRRLGLYKFLKKIRKLFYK